MSITGLVLTPQQEVACCSGTAVPLSSARAKSLSVLLQSLGEPVRLRLLSIVAACPAGRARVSDLVDAFELSQPTISHHLKVLHEAGLLRRAKEGVSVFYQINPDVLGDLSSLLENWRGNVEIAVTKPDPKESNMSTIDPIEQRYERITEELTYKFDGVFSEESVAKAVVDARAALEGTAKVTAFLPVLVERYAKEQLVAAAQAEGKLAKPVPELLFVCVRNAGRSQLAAALANSISAGKVHVRTAGSQPASEVDPKVIEVLSEMGINLAEAFPKPLSNDVVRAADVIVTMGCGDACPIYPGKRYLDWNVADPATATMDETRAIRDDVQQRVTQLLQELGV